MTLGLKRGANGRRFCWLPLYYETYDAANLICELFVENAVSVRLYARFSGKNEPRSKKDFSPEQSYEHTCLHGTLHCLHVIVDKRIKENKRLKITIWGEISSWTTLSVVHWEYTSCLSFFTWCLDLGGIISYKQNMIMTFFYQLYFNRCHWKNI